MRCTRGSASERLGRSGAAGFGRSTSTLRRKGGVLTFSLHWFSWLSPRNTMRFRSPKRIGQERIGLPKGGQVGPALEGGLQARAASALPIRGRRQRRPAPAGWRSSSTTASWTSGTGAGKSFDNAIAVAGEAVVGLVTQRIVEDVNPALLDRRGVRPRADKARQTRRPATAAPARATQRATGPAAAAGCGGARGWSSRKRRAENRMQVGFLLPAQVEPDRSGHRQRAEPEPRIEEGKRHRLYFSRLRSARNRASACQGFSSVRTTQWGISRLRNNHGGPP